MHSAAYDRHLTGSAYAGRFFLDAATDRLYLDTVSPTPQPGTPWGLSFGSGRIRERGPVRAAAGRRKEPTRSVAD